MRRVILHHHIFKNAGSSLDALLMEAFRDAWMSWDPIGPPYGPDTVYGARDIMGFLRLHPDVRAISSHTLRPPSPIMDDMQIVPLLFLRHPILRVGSIYKYDRALDGETERQRVAKQSSFAEYVRWCFDADVVPIFCDFQTLYLSGEQLRYEDPRRARADRAAFLRAIAFLESLEVFGIVEHFADSMTQMQQRLAHLFPEIVWREVHENVTGTEFDTLEKIEQALGPALYQSLVECNAYDMALYKRALQIFESHATVYG